MLKMTLLLDRPCWIKPSEFQAFQCSAALSDLGGHAADSNKQGKHFLQ